MSDSTSHIKQILQIISQRYDIDFEDMYNLVCLHLQKNSCIDDYKETEDPKTCYALVRNKKGVCRCARGPTHGQFCKTHHQQFTDNKLQHGYHKKTNTIRETEKITINNIDYLLDKKTNKVYSVPKGIYIGYLSENTKDIDMIIEINK